MNEHPPWEGIGWVILLILLLFVLLAITRPASGTEARRAETATEIGSSVHDGPTSQSEETPNPNPDGDKG
jgi:hypothetical protein